jgi:hypothetical protein
MEVMAVITSTATEASKNDRRARVWFLVTGRNSTFACTGGCTGARVADDAIDGGNIGTATGQ